MIQTRIEGKRGCGYRKAGALYLVCEREGKNCCKLPFPLDVCPCCGAGVRPSRAWTWVDATSLIGDEVCTSPDALDWQCDPSGLAKPCPLENGLGRAGLVWVGEKFYPTVEAFQTEARWMGISRRIKAVPKGFKLGETWVLLAHRKGIAREEFTTPDCLLPGIQLTRTVWTPAVFSAFKPTAVEYVVKGDETQEQLENLARRNITPVNVNPRRAY